MVVIGFIRAVADVLIAHPHLTQYTIDMLEAVERSTGNRSVLSLIIVVLILKTIIV